MRKIVLISLLVVGLITIWIVAALVKINADSESERRQTPIPAQRKLESGYIRKMTASGVLIDLDLRSADTNPRLVHIGGSVPQTEAAPGTYKPQNITLQATQDGDKWQMVSRGPWGNLETIRVEPGISTELKVGPPLTVKTDVTARDEGVSIGLSIFGQAGERYHPAVQKNNQRQSAPELKIVDETGKVLATGNFAYG